MSTESTTSAESVTERLAATDEAIYAFDRCHRRIVALDDEQLIDLWMDFGKALVVFIGSRN